MAGIVWTGNEGYLSAKNLDKEIRHALRPECKFRQFASVKNAVGKNRGDKFHWNVYSKVANKGAKLVETSPMPQTNFTVTQGEMIITEYGNSVPYTGKIEALSEHNVKEIIHSVMKQDAKEVFDGEVEAEFNKTKLRVAPTGGTSTSAVTLTTNGATTVVNNVALGKDHIKAIVDIMKERNIANFQGNDYAAIARPTTLRQLKNDLEEVHKYVEPGFRMILAGEIGRYEGVRFFEQTNVAADPTKFANGKSDWCYFFGADTVAEGVAVPEEIRAKIPDDYGRGKGIAWYYLGGFALTHKEDATQSRILKWDSTTAG